MWRNKGKGERERKIWGKECGKGQKERCTKIYHEKGEKEYHKKNEAWLKGQKKLERCQRSLMGLSHMAVHGPCDDNTVCRELGKERWLDYVCGTKYRVFYTLQRGLWRDVTIGKNDADDIEVVMHYDLWFPTQLHQTPVATKFRELSTNQWRWCWANEPGLGKAQWVVGNGSDGWWCIDVEVPPALNFIIECDNRKIGW